MDLTVNESPQFSRNPSKDQLPLFYGVKRILFLCLIPLLFSLTSNAQLTTGTYWYYGYVQHFPWGSLKAFKLELTGDTLIAGKTVQKISDSIAVPKIASIVPDYIYEDSGSVYVWRDSFFTKLYDYNLMPGDTWNYVAPYSLPGKDSLITFRVDSVSYGQYNGQTLKEQYVSVLDSFSWEFVDFYDIGQAKIVERIGNVRGFLFPLEPTWQTQDTTVFFACYEDAVLGHYMRPGVMGCINSTLAIQPFDDETLPVIYPNPAKGFIKIHNLGGTIGQRFAILNAQGKIVHSGVVSDDSQTIDLSGISPGIYLIQVFSLENNSFLATKLQIE